MSTPTSTTTGDAVAVDATSTMTTTMVPAASDVSIVGYYSSGTEVATIVCDSDYEFLVSSTYGICCPTTASGNCGFRQTCSRSYMMYEDGSAFTCPNNDPCVETTIYQQEPAKGLSATVAWCMDPDNATSLYRTFVATHLVTDDLLMTSRTTTTSDPDETSTDTRDMPTRTDTLATSTSANPSEAGSDASDSDTASATSTPEVEDKGSGTNVGAIAGGVVGGVAGLALIILAIWFVMRRQKKKNAELREIGAGYVAPEAK
ncbi:hypothetical protein BJX76DRAFT_361404 [Aspergillus varians]